MGGGCLLGHLRWTILWIAVKSGQLYFFRWIFSILCLVCFSRSPTAPLKKNNFVRACLGDNWYGPLCVDRVERRKYPNEDLAIFTNETECLQSGIRFLKS